jgi:hypothetical protein
MDFCCGTTMSARLAPLRTESVQIADVPFLYCQTCGTTCVAPEVSLDVAMYVHHCETDGVREASLCDVVVRERIQAALDAYPAYTPGDPRVSPEQVDHMLDLWNVALTLGDDGWLTEIRDRLALFYRVRQSQRQLQNQS